MRSLKKKMWEHKEAIILISSGEEESERVEVEANELEELNAKENKSTSPKPNEMRE